MRELKIVREDSLHETIASYIQDGDHIIADIEEMKSLVCDMIKAGYMFAMDRDRLRDAIEDFVYLCQPDDVLNKDRLMKSLEYDDEETDEDYEDDYSPRPPIKVNKQQEKGHPVCHDGVCHNGVCHDGVCHNGVCHKSTEIPEVAEVQEATDGKEGEDEEVAEVQEATEAVADGKEGEDEEVAAK